jgi:hypothetical protein
VFTITSVFLKYDILFLKAHLFRLPTAASNGKVFNFFSKSLSFGEDFCNEFILLTVCT